MKIFNPHTGEVKKSQKASANDKFFMEGQDINLLLTM
jgi:hypothetical protein